MLVGPSVIDLSSRILRFLAGQLTSRRQKIGTRWRRLTPGWQALLAGDPCRWHGHGRPARIAGSLCLCSFELASPLPKLANVLVVSVEVSGAVVAVRARMRSGVPTRCTGCGPASCGPPFIGAAMRAGYRRSASHAGADRSMHGGFRCCARVPPRDRREDRREERMAHMGGRYAGRTDGRSARRHTTCAVQECVAAGRRGFGGLSRGGGCRG